MDDDAVIGIAELINGLYDIHIELWDVVDMKKSADDKTVAYAARNNNRLVKLRSDLVERIDESILRGLPLKQYEDEYMEETIGELIEQLGFEKIRIHEENRITGKEDSPSQKCMEINEKLNNMFMAIFNDHK